MTECQKCNDHSGVIKSIEAVSLSLDEREKQNLLRDKITEIRFHSLNDQMNLQFGALKTALGVAEKELERRLQELNGLRQEVTTDRNEFIRRGVYDEKHEALKGALNTLGNRVTIIETRSVVWTSAIGIFFVIVQVLLRYWSNR